MNNLLLKPIAINSKATGPYIFTNMHIGSTSVSSVLSMRLSFLKAVLYDHFQLMITKVVTGYILRVHKV